MIVRRIPRYREPVRCFHAGHAQMNIPDLIDGFITWQSTLPCRTDQETPFVDEQVFQNCGVCGQAFPSLLSPPPPRTFLRPPQFSRDQKNEKCIERAESPTETLATQAIPHDLTTSQDASFWAICLVAFYGMFRKSHLLPTAPHLFNSKKQLTKGNFTICPCVTLITIRWSKTIQFRERVVEIPLPLIPGSSVCPTSAIGHAFRFTAPGSSRDMQAFNWVDSTNVLHVFTYTAFVTKLRYHLSTLGLDARSYAGHSFCRGEHHLRTNRASLSN